MERIAFKMKLKPGMKDEYKKRHDAIWPELKVLISNSGVVELILSNQKVCISLQTSCGTLQTICSRLQTTCGTLQTRF
jgi:L-rhamnose mutarotase